MYNSSCIQIVLCKTLTDVYYIVYKTLHIKEIPKPSI